MRTELLTTLKRRASEILSDLERDKEPIMITQHGLPSAYLVDVESYELQQRRMTILEGIARGERDIAAGNIYSHEEIGEMIKEWRA